MRTSFLRTSTAMVMALSLLQPSAILAQEELTIEGTCADGTELPCEPGIDLILPDGTVVPAEEVPPEAVIGGVPAAEPQPEAAEEAAPVEEPPLEEAAPVEEPSIEEEAAPVEEPPLAEEALPAEEAVPEEVPAEEPALEEPAPEAPAVDEPAVEEPAPEEPAIEEPPVEEEPAPETPAVEEDPAGDLPLEEQPEAGTLDAPDPALEAPEPEPEPAPEVIEAPEADTAVETPAEEAEVVDPTLETPEADAAAGAEGETAVEATAEPQVVVQPGAEEFQDEAARVLQLLGATIDPTGEPEVPAAAAAAEDAEATATVETEITAEETRQSSEDFTTSAAGTEAAPRSRDRLSDFEKAALIGLGALAVGAILSNGDQVVGNTGDRVVVRRGDNDYYVLKDDDTLLRQPGSTVRTETFNDGSTRTTVTRDDGSKIITIRDAAGRVVRRVRENVDGTRVTLINDAEVYEPVIVERLPEPVTRSIVIDETDPLALRLAIERASAANIGRSFSLRQVREISRVRKLVPEISLENITFETGSAAIQPTQARDLMRLGDLMTTLIADNPGEVFLIEGHTDAVGSASYNLALSDRRAESVALALTEYFDVPPENMIVQGYGEGDLKVQTEAAERANRRVAIRRITSLLDQQLARN